VVLDSGASRYYGSRSSRPGTERSEHRRPRAEALTAVILLRRSVTTTLPKGGHAGRPVTAVDCVARLADRRTGG
jgi:hypothetical protein